MGDTANGSSSPSPVRRAVTTSSDGPPAWPGDRTGSSSACTSGAVTGSPKRPKRCSTPTASCSTTSGARTTRSSAPRSPRRWRARRGPSKPPSWCSAPSRRTRLAEVFGGSVINKAIRLSGSIDVHVISTDGNDGPLPSPAARPSDRHGAPRSPVRRRVAGWLLAARRDPPLTALLLIGHESIELPTILLLNLLLVAAVGAVGGLRPAVVAAVVSAQTVNWYLHRTGRDVLDRRLGPGRRHRGSSSAVATLIGVLVGQAARRSPRPTGRAPRPRRWPGFAAGCRDDDDPVRAMLGHLLVTFGQDAVAIIERGADGRWRADLAEGEPVPDQPLDGESVQLEDGLVLVLVPGRLAVEDRRVLDSFAAQLADGARATLARGGRHRGRRPVPGRGAADRHPPCGVARPALASRLHQGVVHEPAPVRRRLVPGPAPRVRHDHRRGGRPPQPPRRQPARHEPHRGRRPGAGGPRGRARRGGPARRRRPGPRPGGRRHRPGPPPSPRCGPTRRCSSG